jgi:hypothetical protein
MLAFASIFRRLRDKDRLVPRHNGLNMRRTVKTRIWVCCVGGLLLLVLVFLWHLRLSSIRGRLTPGESTYHQLRGNVARYGHYIVYELDSRELAPGEYTFVGAEAMELARKQVAWWLEDSAERARFFDRWGEGITFAVVVREVSGPLEYELTLHSKGPNRRDDSGGGDDVVYGPTRYSIPDDGFGVPHVLESPPTNYWRWKEERRQRRSR